MQGSMCMCGHCEQRPAPSNCCSLRRPRSIIFSFAYSSYSNSLLESCHGFDHWSHTYNNGKIRHKEKEEERKHNQLKGFDSTICDMQHCSRKGQRFQQRGNQGFTSSNWVCASEILCRYAS